MLKDFFKSKNGRITVYVAAVVLVALFVWLTVPQKNQSASPGNLNGSLIPANEAALNVPTEDANANAAKSGASKPAVKKPAPKPVGFAVKNTAHFVSSSIANNATISQVPVTLTLTFDAPITKTTESFITVKRDQIYTATIGNSYIGGDAKTMSINLNPQVQDGDYYVYYVACFADVGCQDGRFGYRLKLP